jgi:SAM-dependent methyltransferase
LSYLETTEAFYRMAAATPDVGLCCTTSAGWEFPGLSIPARMHDMNYGCGTTVHPRDLSGSPDILYVGVGGGMELLQFAYFARRTGGVIGIDSVGAMLDACRANLDLAAQENSWFDPSFVRLQEGHALGLPVEDASIDVAAQNCLFNIFKPDDLEVALAEMFRVLRPRGRFVLSDPISQVALPEHLREDETLRATCISGAPSYQEYIDALVGAGFGTIEVRARRPYRLLDPKRYQVERPILLESVEVVAIKDPIAPDGACVFTGKTAIYFGDDEFLDDGAGHILLRGTPLAVCDKTAQKLSSLGRNDIQTTPSTWFYDGGGCC